MESKSKLIYQRALLKLSGEALQGSAERSLDSQKLQGIGVAVANVMKLGVQLAIVIGGGNIIRGTEIKTQPISRITADHMGMLATMINGLALRDAFESQGLSVDIMSAIGVPGLIDVYNRSHAKKSLQKGNVVIFVAGTGNPLVTTDTAAALRGIEVDANVILKATKVDGVFAADPVKNPKAARYDFLTYDEILDQRLGVMDLNAILLCREHQLPLRIFNMNMTGALQKILLGENVGTLIQDGEK